MRSPLPQINDKPEHAEIIARLPNEWTAWPQDSGSSNAMARTSLNTSGKTLKKSKLAWPKRPVVFISDPHADATAFEASLIAAGVATQRKAGLGKLKLTKSGRKTEIIIGGDCLDKGPSNLSLLRSVKQLYRLKARVTLLAGNHDLRLIMGLLALARKKDIGNQHFFVRMGKKVVPLFKEVFEQYLADTKWDKKIPDEETCRGILFPNDKWFEAFPYHAAGQLTAEGIDREVRKMRSKVQSFENHCLAAGLSLRHVYAASLMCQKLFLHKKGEFAWFFRKMKLVEKRGSFLFLHAGLDDTMGELLLKSGIKYANKAFHRNLKHRDLFGFYYSSIANTFRTKYRDADLPLTERGVKAIHKAGIHVVVQGHVNRQQGQRVTVKKGLIHVEADITLDEHSRRSEGLDSYGIGATLISKRQGLIGISCDYPTAKVMKPQALRQIYG